MLTSPDGPVYRWTTIGGAVAACAFLLALSPAGERPTEARDLRTQNARPAIALSNPITDAVFVPYVGKVSGIQPTDTPFFGMQVESVVGDAEEVTVTTTGTIYVLNRRAVALWRRIDPKTNSVHPRQVATLSFASELGPLRVVQSNRRSATIEGPAATLTFHSDSLFLVRAKRGLTYTHSSSIPDAPWIRGSGADRMWTDGYGGSLHARVRGNPRVSVSDMDTTTLALSLGDEMAHMAFPPRLFDFERLYGPGERPLVMFIYSTALLENVLENLEELEARHIGVFMLWCSIYDQMDNRSCSEPVVLESGIKGYQIRADLEPRLHSFIRTAHRYGFRVIPYLSYPSGPRWNYPEGHPRVGQHQQIDVTLRWMRQFQLRHGFDGWYFDNANAGDFMADYDFIRQVRADVGDDGIIYHHDSVDVWGAWDGRRAVMVDAYVDYTLTGETGRATGEKAEVDDPNNAYFRYYTAGYGMSQAFAAHKRLSSMRIAMSEKEKDRLIGQNLNGTERTVWYGEAHPDESWLTGFLPGYRMRRAQYQAGDFVPDVDWPLDPLTSWFREPANVHIERPPGDSAVITWLTGEPADSEVAYTSNGVWWSPNGPDGIVSDTALATEHRVEVADLDPEKAYEFRIRSSNRRSGLEEVVWGWVGGAAAAERNGRGASR